MNLLKFLAATTVLKIVSCFDNQPCDLSVINCVENGCAIDTSVCQQCDNSLILANEGAGCAVEIDNCSQYSSDLSSCLVCDGEDLFTSFAGTECIQLQNCLQQSSVENNCEICKDDYRLSQNDSTVCVPVIEKCIQYESDEKCLACDENYQLTNGLCLETDSKNGSQKQQIYTMVICLLFFIQNFNL